MKYLIKIKPYIFIIVLCATGFVLGGCKKDTLTYGEAFIYMPQATQSGGVNNQYLVPSGGGDMTRNFRMNNGKVEIMLGVSRSSTLPSEEFTVDVVVRDDETNSFVSSGAIALPAGSYSLPSRVTVTSSNEATFYLSVDSAMLISDLAYSGQKMVLAVGIDNPTKYKLSENNILTMVIIDIDAIRDHYFKYREGFLYRKADKLMLNGKPYQCLGFNGAALSGCGAAGEAFSDAEIDALFASLPDNILVRTWAFPGSKAQTDKIIKAAEKNNIKLILTLGDSHKSCGDNENKNEQWYRSGFRQAYLTHAKDMASTYRNSPAIGMWEMLNAPTFWDAPLEDIKAFYNEVAKELKAADPNHLVATGTWANWAYGGKAGFETLHNSNYIDVGTMHDGDPDVVEAWSFADCQSAMKALNKVLIVSDIGIEGAEANCMYSKAGRAAMMKNKFDLYLEKGAGAALAAHIVKSAPNGCSRLFGIDDPIAGVVKTHPANAALGK